MTQLLSIKEAREVLKVGETKIRDLIATGDLRARKIGRRTLIESPSIDAFVDALPAHTPRRRVRVLDAKEAA